MPFDPSAYVNELNLLGASIILGLVYLSWAAIAARRQQGLNWARGPRDEPKPVSGRAARLERAFANYMETFPFFAAAVIAGELVGERDAVSLWGALLYVGARILYLPAYGFGAPFRFHLWALSMIGLLMVVGSVFF